jgi:hypothetical protein
VHQSQLRDWAKKLTEDPQHAFSGNGQMKPEQLEIARLIPSLYAAASARRLVLIVWSGGANSAACGPYDPALMLLSRITAVHIGS